MIPLNENLAALRRSGIRRFTALAQQTPDCVKLTIGEPDLDTPAPIRDAAVQALMGGATHYAPNQGTPALREAIAAFETARGNVTKPENVLVTVGATQALFLSMLGVLNQGDEVIIPTPAFNLYESIAAAAGAKAVRLDIAKNGFQITPDALRACITDKTKAIVLNSPCNPTGTVYSRESLGAVRDAVRGRPVFVIWDGVYSALSYGDFPDLTLDETIKDQTILCQSFSKPYAMTGWRIGYLTCPDGVMERLLLLGAANIAAVPTFIQHAAITALTVDPAPMRDIYLRRRGLTCRRLTEMGLSYPEPQGAFYAFPDISRFGLSSEEFCTRMIREGRVAAVPGSCFGLDSHIRLSYCCRDDALQTGLDRMEKFLKTLG